MKTFPISKNEWKSLRRKRRGLWMYAVPGLYPPATDKKRIAANRNRTLLRGPKEEDAETFRVVIIDKTMREYGRAGGNPNPRKNLDILIPRYLPAHQMPAAYVKWALSMYTWHKMRERKTPTVLVLDLTPPPEPEPKKKETT